MLHRPSSHWRIPSTLLLLLSLPALTDAFFFGNSGCGCQLLPPPPPPPVLDTCTCRSEQRNQVFRDPPTLPFMPLQQSSIYYAPPPAASPTYYSAPSGPVIAREYIPVSSYQTSPVGFQTGTFPVSQDSGASYQQASFSRRPQFAFQRSNQDRLNRYTSTSYSLPPLQPPPISLPPPIILPPIWPGSLPSPAPATPTPADWPGWTPPPPPPPPRPTPPPSDWVTSAPSNPYAPWPTTTQSPADWPGWTTQPPPPPPPPRPTPPPSDWIPSNPYGPRTTTQSPADWPGWTTQPPPPPPPPRPTPPPSDWVTQPPSNPYGPQTTTQSPADFPGWTTQPPPPPPPPTTTTTPAPPANWVNNPYWTITPPPQDWTTQTPPPPPPPPTSKPWNPYKPHNQIYSVNDIVVDVMRPPPDLSRFPPGFQDEVREFRKKHRKHKKLVKKA